VNPVSTSVPPNHETVVDLHEHRTTSPVVVDLETGRATVHVEGLGEGRSTSLAAERSIRRSEETGATRD
jgi:hypothetical protein